VCSIVQKTKISDASYSMPKKREPPPVVDQAARAQDGGGLSAQRLEGSNHLVQIQKRQFGYAFGGPEPSWCNSNRPKKDGMRLSAIAGASPNQAPVGRFTGCRKYEQCELVHPDVKWEPWESLTKLDQQELLRIRCYRATRGGWDKGAFEARRKAEHGRWIGNPFGIRNSTLGSLADELGERLNEHRDLSPCPVGGCVTPEMQRDYLADTRQSDHTEPVSGRSTHAEQFWADAEVCPFFYRFSGPDQLEAAHNSQRFTQCYLTAPEFRRWLEALGIVVAAPILRASLERGARAFWYSFFSGFAFLQLPTRAPTERGWEDATLPLRWHATAVARLTARKVYGHPPIQRIFDSAENGTALAAWERQERLVSISDGQATAFLLQWLLIRRLRALLSQNRSLKGPYDLTASIEWVYEERGGAMSDLSTLGYAAELESHLGIARSSDGTYTRTSSLHEDFVLLGLVDREGRPTKRLTSCITYLYTRLRGAEDGNLHPGDMGSLVRGWLGRRGARIILDLHPRSSNGDVQVLLGLCTALLASAGGDLVTFRSVENGIRDLLIEDPQLLAARLTSFEQDDRVTEAGQVTLKQINRLVAPVHVLVRSHWEAPLRWVFVPASGESRMESSASFEPFQSRERMRSGLIVMLEDDLASQPYNLDAEQVDPVLERLRVALPVLFSTANIEGELLQEEVVKNQQAWDMQREQVDWLQHLTRTIRSLTSNDASEQSVLVLGFLGLIENSLVTLPEFQKSRSTPCIDVCFGDAFGDVFLSFQAYFERRKKTKLEMRGRKATRLWVRALSDDYREEIDESRRRRATADLTLLLLDLLAQRVSAQESTIVMEISGGGVIRVITSSEFEDVQKWDSETSDMDYWQRKRGFYLTFSVARAMGSTRQRVCNESGNGIIEIHFETEKPADARSIPG